MGENLVINRTVIAVQLKKPAWWSTEWYRVVEY